MSVSDNDLSIPAAYEALFSAPANNLTDLRLVQTACGHGCLKALAASHLCPQLLRLAIGGNRMNARGARLLAAGRFTRLQSLFLSGDADLSGDGPLEAIGPSGAVALARSPNLAHVMEMFLPNHAMGDVGLKALMTSPHLTRLKRLDLRHNDITSRGARALLRYPRLKQLEILDLDSNHISHRVTKALGDRLGNKLRDFKGMPTGVPFD